MGVRIDFLKYKARRAYSRYWAEVSSLSCGRTLAEHVSSGVSSAKREFNETMDKLAKLDPACPKDRL